MIELEQLLKDACQSVTGPKNMDIRIKQVKQDWQTFNAILDFEYENQALKCCLITFHHIREQTSLSERVNWDSRILLMVEKNEPINRTLTELCGLIAKGVQTDKIIIWLTNENNQIGLVIAPSLTYKEVNLLAKNIDVEQLRDNKELHQTILKTIAQHDKDCSDWGKAHVAFTHTVFSATGHILGAISIFHTQNWQQNQLERSLIERYARLVSLIINKSELANHFSGNFAHLYDAQRLSRTGSFAWQPNNGQIYWSDETYRIFEVPRNTVVTMDTARERIHPDDIDLFNNRVKDGPSIDDYYEYEHRLLFSDNRIKYLKIRARIARNAAGEVTEIIGAVMDISEQNRHKIELEQALVATQRTKKQFDLAVNTIPGLVWTSLPDGNIDFLNQRWLEYTGMQASLAENWGWQAAIHPDDLPGLIEYWKDLLQAGEAGEYVARLQRFDGVYRWFLFRAIPSYDEKGTLIKWYGQTTDIDERKRAEFLLADERNLLELIVQQDSLPTILGNLCTLVSKNLHFTHCCIAVVNTNTHNFNQLITAQKAQEWLFEPLQFAQNPFDLCIALGKTVHVSDGITDLFWKNEKWVNWTKQKTIKECVAIPIVSKNQRVFGVFCLYAHQADYLQHAQMELLNRFVYFASIAIEKNDAQIALKKSQDYLSKAQQISHTGSFGWELVSNSLFWSKETYNILGYPSDVEPNLSMILKRVHPDDLAFVKDVYKKARMHLNDMAFQCRLKMPDGRLKYLDVAGHSQLNQFEEMEYVGAVMDITEREKTARALLASEKLARGQVTSLIKTLDSLASELLAEKSVEQVIRTITQQLQAHGCEVWLQEENGQTLCLAYQLEHQVFVNFTYNDAETGVLTRSRIVNHDYLIEQVKQSGVHSIVENVLLSGVSAWRDEKQKKHIQALLNIPLLVAGKTEGVISIHFTNKRHFILDEVNLAQALSHQLMLLVQLIKLSNRSREMAVFSERNRLARDIHDTLAHGLTGVIMQLEAAIDANNLELKAELIQHIENASVLARESLQEARRSVRALKPKALKEYSLSDALQNVVTRMTKDTAIQANVMCQGVPAFKTPGCDEHLLRIGQELVTNAVRHSKCSHISLKILFSMDEIQLHFKDNGCGFDTGQNVNGFGLAGIRERVTDMRGNINIESKIGEGTTITIVLPYC